VGIQRRLHPHRPVLLLAHRPTQAVILSNAGQTTRMGVPTCRLRLSRRSFRNDSLLAKLADTGSVQTRQEACVVPRNHPIEQLGVGHSEETSSESQSDSDVRTRASLSLTPVETALPVDTPVSAKRVVDAGSPVLSEAVRPSTAG